MAHPETSFHYLQWGFPGGPMIKNALPMQELRRQGSILGGDFLENDKPLSILCLKIPWTEAVGYSPWGLGSQT